MAISVERASAVLALFEAYYERVFCFARRSLPVEQAEDIAQEVFTRLLELKNLENLELSVSYLIKIADNLIKRNYGRSQRFLRFVKSTPVQETFEAPQPRAMDAVDADAVTQAMNRLTDNEQNAVRLIICEGMSYEDAATSLGVAVSTVNNWKYRGVQKLHNSVFTNDRNSGARAGGVAANAATGDSSAAATQATPAGRGRRKQAASAGDAAAAPRLRLGPGDNSHHHRHAPAAEDLDIVVSLSHIRPLAKVC